MKLFFMITLTLFFLIQFILLIPSYAENQTSSLTEIEQELKTLSTLLDNHDKTSLTEIEQELKSLSTLLDNHNKTSVLNSNTSLWFGGIVGSLGLVVTIVLAYKEISRRKKEAEKIKKTETKIKWTLGDILDYLEALKKTTPEKDKLKDIPAWKKIIELVKVLRISAIPISKDLKEDLGDYILGFIVYMEKHFERSLNNEEIKFSALISSTKTIIDKYFQTFYEEKEESRKAELEHFEEEFAKSRAQEEEMLQKYFQEKMEEQMGEDMIVDDMIADDVLDEERDEKRRDEEREKERRDEYRKEE